MNESKDPSIYITPLKEELASWKEAQINLDKLSCDDFRTYIEIGLSYGYEYKIENGKLYYRDMI